MTYYVYLLRLQNGLIYVGSTDDLERRYREHLDGIGSKATAESKPVALSYSEIHPARSAAMRRERQLKKWTRAKKLALAQGNLERRHQLSQRK